MLKMCCQVLKCRVNEVVHLVDRGVPAQGAVVVDHEVVPVAVGVEALLEVVVVLELLLIAIGYILAI